MTSIAAKARAAALQVEAKKHALRQQQDGCWILTMKVHQNDMPEEIMKAAMGQRYVCALVAVDDDEQPKEVMPTGPKQANVPDTKPRPVQSPGSVGAAKERRPFEEMLPAQQSGILCREPAFWTFMRERNPRLWVSSGYAKDGQQLENWDTAANLVRVLCGVPSRSDITRDNLQWAHIVSAYRLWQREAEVVPA